VDADGDFVIAWHDDTRDGSDFGIFAQRFRATSALDIDGNGLLQPLNDGVLVVRRLFGFTDAALTDGAVGAGCARCEAAPIAGYITGLGSLLDVDGNLKLGPLTDGLLILRFLFGSTDDALTDGAVGDGCSRCDAAAIVLHLQGLI